MVAKLNWYGHAVDDFAQDLFGLLGAFERRGISCTDDKAVRKGWQGQFLEVIRGAEVAAFEECHGLRRTIERLRLELARAGL